MYRRYVKHFRGERRMGKAEDGPHSARIGGEDLLPPWIGARRRARWRVSFNLFSGAAACCDGINHPVIRNESLDEINR